MNDNKYEACPCGSGKKFKFCCYEKRETLRGVSDAGLTRRAAEFPVDKCFISQGWKERGLAQVLVARQLPDGTSLIASYLVDVFCLGIKNAFVARLKPDEMRPFLNSCPDAMQEISYEDARSVIMGAVEFAMRFGLPPHESWVTSRAIVESDRPFGRKFDFGKDGKPFYIAGPHDDTRRIMKQLAPLVKEGNAHYLCVDDSFPDDIAEDQDDEILFEEWCGEISCLLEDVEFEDAKEAIEDFLQDYPERWEPLYFKATCLMLEGNDAQAIPFFDRAIAIQPSPEAYFNLANAHRSLLHIEEWIACLKKVIEFDGDAGDIGESAKADVDDFASTIQRNDGLSLDRYFEVGKMFERAFEDLTSGRFGDAVCGFSDVVKILPRHVQSYGNLGLAYAALGDRRRALECLEEAISIDPAYQPAIDNRRILMDQPFADRPLVGAMRQIDFYGDRARERSRQRPAPLRVACR